MSSTDLVVRAEPTDPADRSAPAEAGYSRITVVGSRHRVDVAIPSDEPMGTLLAELLAVLDEKLDGSAVSIVTGTGMLIDSDTALATAGIPDGTILRIVPVDEVPPPPVVNDVTEETAANTDRHPGHWSLESRRALAVGAVAVAAGTASWQAAVADTPTVRVAIGIAAGLLLLSHLGLIVVARMWPATAAAVAAGVLGIGAVIVDGGLEYGWASLDVAGIALALAWCTSMLIALGWRDRGWFVGSVLGVVLTCCWLVLRRSSIGGLEVDALLATAVAVGFGSLPRWALTASGLASLDDDRLAGAAVSRVGLRRSLIDAHRMMIATTAAVCATAAIAGVLLASDGEPWPAGLAAAVAVVLALRSRTLPLGVEVTAALAAAAAIGAVLLSVSARQLSAPGWPMVITGLVGVAAVVVLVVEPPPHVRARLRRLADRLEALAVLALIPLLIGVFGVYGRLLHTF